jgi:TRAP-type C4-dicarboxylate transport system substrate-binding protein
MKNAINWQRNQAASEDDASKAKLIKAGMKFDSISPQVRAQLVASTKGVVTDLKKRIGAEVVDAVLSAAK